MEGKGYHRLTVVPYIKVVIITTKILMTTLLGDINIIPIEQRGKLWSIEVG